LRSTAWFTSVGNPDTMFVLVLLGRTDWPDWLKTLMTSFTASTT